MIKRILSSQSNSITGAAVVLGLASFVSRLIGIVRDRLFAHHFGAGDVLDAYYAAFRIPDLVYNLIIVGALSAGFIPIFISYLNNKKKAWELVNVVLNVMLFGLIIISGFLIFLAPYIVKLIAPGFSPDQLIVTANLSRIMFLSPILLGIYLN